jgi:hypothetical protein
MPLLIEWQYLVNFDNEVKTFMCGQNEFQFLKRR